MVTTTPQLDLESLAFLLGECAEGAADQGGTGNPRSGCEASLRLARTAAILADAFDSAIEALSDLCRTTTDAIEKRRAATAILRAYTAFHNPRSPRPTRPIRVARGGPPTPVPHTQAAATPPVAPTASQPPARPASTDADTVSLPPALESPVNPHRAAIAALLRATEPGRPRPGPFAPAPQGLATIAPTNSPRTQAATHNPPTPATGPPPTLTG